MRIPAFVCAAFILAASVQANIIPLDGTSTINISGHVAILQNHGGATDSYAQTQTVAGVHSLYQNSLSDSATATAIPQPGWVYFLPLEYNASSQATQTATVGQDLIHLTGNLRAQSGAHAQVGTMTASASSLFDLTFKIDEAEVFALTLESSLAHFPFHFGTLPPPAFSLTTIDGTPIAGVSDLIRTGGSASATWSLNGLFLLGPGDYRLQYSAATAGLAWDPLGESSTVSYDVRLAAVPDAASTVALLSAAMLPLALVHRRRGHRAG